VNDAVPRFPSRLLDGLPSPDRERAGAVLARSPAIDLDRRAPLYQPAFAGAALLVVEEGFVVVRATFPADARSVVTVDAGPGAVLLPPTADEVLVALGPSRVTLVSADARDRLLASPALARRVVEQLAFGLAQRQEALANFAPTRHTERVRRKLLQLARRYGHVVRDGIRIDVPLSHALLAEMIGSSRETVTRALDELERDRFVVRAGSTYRLLVSAESLTAPSP
jgi:CRP/FNR family transcriptional regulator, cyclic AMP receptor protein